MSEPRMTRAHFEFIASVIRESGQFVTPDQRAWWAQEFANALTKTNTAFNYDRFISAATAETHQK